MASPMVESRIEPHKKAHFSLHISDRAADSDRPQGAYSSVKYNHKPAQTSEARTTRLTSTSATSYSLKVEDKSSSGSKDVFTFTGHRVASKKSYVLLLDPTSQKATLEPLSDTYTFNIATKNNRNIAPEHDKVYPKKSKDSQRDEEGEEDLFGEAVQEDESGDPDPNNPYDFRHFLDREKGKRGDESDYHNMSSPDYKTGTGSAMNTPQLGARKPAPKAAPKAKPAEPVQKKRKTAESGMFMKKKPGVKKAQPPPAIHLERRASERPSQAAAPKPKARPAAPPSSKIKSAELVHSSDESDADAEGEAESVSSPPPQTRRSPSPQYHAASEPEDEDAEGESDDEGGLLEIEVPDARPSRPQQSLKALGLGQSLGMGRGFKSPSQGPISLESATNSAHGSPNPATFTPRKNRTLQDMNVIDFDDDGGEEDAEGEDDDNDDNDAGELEIDEGDRDVDVIDIGPPARHGHDRKPSMGDGGAAPAEEDEEEEDPLYQEMMAGLAGDNSSEESEEE
ncbi:hypothetical protein BDU57DRAFT_586315 [Ampelomyces quisqualis]|uniref:Transcription elongation factor Eaf N-terminal domain-containing protein n=1 Tax=Ampelomyces quisqualis TaxID=50730 RepID=A0A6A5QQI3_AMPQU|nr:hypothetical protein BDU57DRAFT_586315 [Ampelomyces quisqualis]